MDKENEILRGRLTTLKEEMEDATEKMNEVTEELHSTQIKTVEYKGIYANNTYPYYDTNLNILNLLYHCRKAIKIRTRK